MQELNHIQMVIINNLTFKIKARFAELNTEKISNDQFNYHLKTLVENEYISKDLDSYYSLTLKGKQFASQTDVYNLKIEKQSKIHLVPVCVKEFEGVRKFLIHKRTKHPFFGWQGFPSGKAKWGNNYSEEVLRELEEETGLTGEPVLKAIIHLLVKIKGTDEIVEDKQFWFYRIDDLRNELIEKTIEGENSWMTYEEIQNSENIYADNPWVASIIDNKGVKVVERVDEYEQI